MANSRVRHLSKNVYTLALPTGQKEAALVTFGASDTSYGSGSVAVGSRSEFVPWGAKNDQLSLMHALATESPNKWRLIKTRRDFIAGLGVYVHAGEKAKKGESTQFAPVISPDFKAWKELVLWDIEFVSFVLQYAFSGNAFVKITLGVDKKCDGLESIDAFKVRIRKLQPGETRISAYLVNPNFGKRAYKAADTTVLPAFDWKNPTKYPVCILHLADRMPGQDYYSFPEWWGTEMWSKVANKIPKFHDSGLDNGYNIKYHISIPDDYFDKEGLDEDAQEQLKEDVLQQMGDSFSGVDNAEKVIFTFHKSGLQSDKIGGVLITPMKNPMSDDAYTALFKTANEVQASGHGVLPALAGIDTGGKLGGSGKELESAANYQQYYLTYVDRLVLLQVLYAVKRINGWPPELEFDIHNISMYTFDVTPAGSGQNPTTTDKSDPSNAD